MFLYMNLGITCRTLPEGSADIINLLAIFQVAFHRRLLPRRQNLGLFSDFSYPCDFLPFPPGSWHIMSGFAL
jgi:hypothetical protein